MAGELGPSNDKPMNVEKITFPELPVSDQIVPYPTSMQRTDGTRKPWWPGHPGANRAGGWAR